MAREYTRLVSSPPPSRPGRREIVQYLRDSAGPLQAAITVHREFMTHLTPLYQQTSAGHAATAAVRARTIGKQYGGVFKQAREKVQAVTVPQPAARGHEYLLRWLGFLIDACDALAQASIDGRDTQYLTDAHDFLDDARYAAKALGEIRQRLHDAVAKPAAGAAKPPTAPRQSA
jgi:hypothetical protein